MIDKNQFTDKVRITIKAGAGGDGMNSFKAYKGNPPADRTAATAARAATSISSAIRT